MNRRKFCGLTVLAALFGPGAIKAAIPAGPRCRVTVLRRECYADLQSRFLDEPETGPCSCFAVGDSFVSRAGECPKGFCPKAWKVVCTAEKGEKGTVVCCPDGTRPVIFRVEYV